MIKRNGQHTKPGRSENAPSREETAYREGFEAIKSDYETLCFISQKLREVERIATHLNAHDLKKRNNYPELNDSTHGRNPWEVCIPLMQLDKNEVLLCKKAGEHGTEYAVIDHSPATSLYAKAKGGLDILETSHDPRHVLRSYLRSEGQALELMANDITASLRIFMEERFPKQDVSRTVNALTRMCKNAAQLGLSEKTAETSRQMRA